MVNGPYDEDWLPEDENEEEGSYSNDYDYWQDDEWLKDLPVGNEEW